MSEPTPIREPIVTVIDDEAPGDNVGNLVTQDVTTKDRMLMLGDHVVTLYEFYCLRGLEPSRAVALVGVFFNSPELVRLMTSSEIKFART